MIRNKFKDKFGIKDALLIIGAAGLFYGIWLIFPPAAYIVAGAGLIFIGMR